MTETILRFVGVYHADGGIRGEAAYVIGRIRGTVHCGLCDLTHRGLGRKRSWTAMAGGFGVTFDLLHRNELDPRIEAVCAGQTPWVLADTGERLIRLLGPAELDACDGDVGHFRRILLNAVEAHGLSLPGTAAGTRE